MAKKTINKNVETFLTFDELKNYVSALAKTVHENNLQCRSELKEIEKQLDGLERMIYKIISKTL